jgi:hypothetical protein
VRQEKSVNGTVEHNNLDLLVSFQRFDDLVELRNSFRAKDVERRVIKRDAPIPGDRRVRRICLVIVVSLMCSSFLTSAAI